MTDLENLRAMLVRAGIEFEESTPEILYADQIYTEISVGTKSPYTTWTFDQDGELDHVNSF